MKEMTTIENITERLPGTWTVSATAITEQMRYRGQLIAALREASKAAVWAGNTELAKALAHDADHIPMIDLLIEDKRRTDEEEVA
jgi:hypothetical protein